MKWKGKGGDVREKCLEREYSEGKRHWEGKGVAGKGRKERRGRLKGGVEGKYGEGQVEKRGSRVWKEEAGRECKEWRCEPTGELLLIYYRWEGEVHGG